MTLSISLGDKRSLNKAIKYIEKYANTLEKKCNTFVKRVGELGIDIAKTYVSHYDIPNGIADEIKLEKGDIVVSGATIQIIVSNEDALFWEYGTGIVGKKKSHPNPDSWVYDVNEHGNKGWFYSKENGVLTKWSRDTNRGLYWTHGMEAQPFMWYTYNDLLYSQWGSICDIASEVFK